jgi:MFS family permease
MGAVALMDDLAPTVRRNTIVLAVCMTLTWAVVQLMAALAAVTLTMLTGHKALAGFGPATFLAAWAVSTLLVGRFMDSHGRAPGLRLGFLSGAVGCIGLFFAVRGQTAAGFLPALALVGGGAGAVNLARAGAADMYPPERRGRGISYVLVGAAFGAILGPVAFTPLLAGRAHDVTTLSVPWILAAVVMLAGVALTFAIRVDPMEIARRLRAEDVSVSQPPALRSLAAMLRSPVVRAAMLAAVLAQGVMSTMMSIVGVAMVEHGHDLVAVEIAMSGHFLGMFGFVLAVGSVVDRVGRDRSVLGGMSVIAGGCLLLLPSVALGWTIPAMFLIGIGWNVSFVAATAMLADAAQPQERGRLLGFVDFVALAVASGGSVIAGLMLGTVGLDPMVLVAGGIALIPVLIFLVTRPRTPVPPGAEPVPG